MNTKTNGCRFFSKNILLALTVVTSAVAVSGCSQPKPEEKPAEDIRGFPSVPDLSKPTPKYLELRKAGENYFDQLKKRPSTFDSDFSEAQTSGKKPKMLVTARGVQYQDIEEGFGLIPKRGGVTLIHYTGWLSDGTQFDSSLKNGQPFKFTYGKGEVIIGLEDGIQGMKVGGTRVLIIPPNLAYGSRGHEKIPANATLTYKIKLLSTGKG